MILAADTCLGACSVALLRDGEILAHRWQAMERGHAEALAPMVEDVMTGHAPASLTRLAVTVGPGTFTGQRVGLSFMRGLRLALRRPLLGLTSLETMAAAACDATGQTRAAAIHDARRGEAYLALWEKGAMTLAPTVLAFDDAVRRIAAFGPCALAGTGAPQAKDSLGDDFALCGIRQPDALMLAQLAGLLPDPPPDAAPPGPLYLRAPDARLPGGHEPVQPFSGDPALLAALHASAFDRAWDTRALEDLLAAPGAFALAAGSGFVLARAAGGEAEILTIAVAPSARRRGLGRALVRAAAARARDLGADALFLEVAAGNDAALGLYAGLGFARVGMRKAYYENGYQEGAGDALVLKAALPLAANLS